MIVLEKNVKNLLWNRSIDGKIYTIYFRQLKSSEVRSHTPPKYNFLEFKNWCIKNPTFQYLYKNWVENNYITDLAPSIDRIDDSKGYSFKNIRVCTWKENRNKKPILEKLGLLKNKQMKPVLQICKETGKVLNEFCSISIAARLLGLHKSNIYRCCKNKFGSTGGFNWRYKL